ncbi:MAG: hypothetical protein A2Z88_04935 [Omnitrophica WOR_2 bacterium GWA2_47_8]|nr:MAG: hypothetical protein A2Z88_04935 [Omnitrophica WOR_2 bacterium GWA2_47_8]
MRVGFEDVLDLDGCNGDSYRFDYVVVGSGAGGSVAARLLAKAGFSVAVLEEGLLYRTNDVTRKIGEMSSRIYRNGGVFPMLGNPIIALVEGSCVGGTTMGNGALLFRTPQWILQKWRSEYGLEGYGASDLVEHFRSIEKELHASTYGPSTKGNEDSKALLRGAKRLGWDFVYVTRALKGCKNSNQCPAGCPTGAKQSMMLTYLPKAIADGAKLFIGCRATRIVCDKGRATHVIAQISKEGRSKKVRFSFKHLILCGGAIQTPFLLRKSGMAPLAGKNLEFHINLHFVARFEEPINAQDGTFLTVQVTEFQNDGLVIMPTNMNGQYLAMDLVKTQKPKVLNDVLGNAGHYGIYTAMIKAASKARIASWIGKSPYVFYWLCASDYEKVKSSIKTACELLFKSGAESIFLPLAGSKKVSDMAQIEKVLERLPKKDIGMSCVHIMSSCPMGTDRKRCVVDNDGRVYGYGNVLIADASVLPTNIGQSPQETIMAFSHEIIKRHLRNVRGKA